MCDIWERGELYLRIWEFLESLVHCRYGQVEIQDGIIFSIKTIATALRPRDRRLLPELATLEEIHFLAIRPGPEGHLGRR